MQFGRVVDATLMIDKDTGRPRGFGFVTFDSEAAVEKTLSRPLEILGKPIEVKKALPRGNLRENNDQRGGQRNGGYRDQNQNDGGQQQAPQQGQGSTMTPQMMAQYWQRMQQYFTMMQQSMSQGQGMPGMNMNPAMMNPAMLQQMQQMQMRQQQQQQQMGNQQQGAMSPGPQSPGSQQAMPNMMNPGMMQPNQANSATGGPGSDTASPGPNAAAMAANRQPGPGYNAHEQLAFEQQKYEQQQVRRSMDPRGPSPYQQQGGPTSWEGMYDEVPQPHVPGGPAGMRPIRSLGSGMGLLWGTISYPSI
jgi:RNA-binding protein Musashi